MQLGAVDARGRAGLERSLLQVSVSRASGPGDGSAAGAREAVAGVSITVRQSVHGCAHAMLNLLLARAAPSLLVVGAAGSGRTCLLRDAARVLAGTGARVLCVDTRGDLGGDGALAHAGLGDARRLLVRRRGEQAETIAEALANHAPSVLIVDELEGAADVAALRRARLRGVRVLAGACGDLAQLLRSRSSRDELLGPGTAAADCLALSAAPQRLFGAAVQAVGGADCADRSLLVLADAAAAADAVALALGGAAEAAIGGSTATARARQAAAHSHSPTVVEVERRRWVEDPDAQSQHCLCASRELLML